MKTSAELQGQHDEKGDLEQEPVLDDHEERLLTRKLLWKLDTRFAEA